MKRIIKIVFKKAFSCELCAAIDMQLVEHLTDRYRRGAVTVDIVARPKKIFKYQSRTGSFISIWAKERELKTYHQWYALR